MGQLAPRVDTRTDGGYIAAPPSAAAGRAAALDAAHRTLRAAEALSQHLAVVLFAGIPAQVSRLLFVPVIGGYGYGVHQVFLVPNPS